VDSVPLIQRVADFITSQAIILMVEVVESQRETCTPSVRGACRYVDYRLSIMFELD
jgi:hypothetical protein